MLELQREDIVERRNGRADVVFAGRVIVLFKIKQIS